MAELIPAREPTVLGSVDDTVVQLVLGVTDPASFNREYRFPTNGGKTAFFQSQWQSLSGDNFSGFPVYVIIAQDAILQNNFTQQLPITTPLSSLTIARFRDLVRCFVIQDKNVVGGACPMLVFNRLGSTALRIDLLSALSAVGEKEYGGAAYWPKAFAPTQYGAATGGPWSQNAYLNKVAPLQDNLVTTTSWQGFSAYRAAHGPVLGTGNWRKDYWIHIDGAPWAKPSFNLYRSSVPNAARAGVGICGYICSWANATVPATDLPSAVAYGIGGQWLTQPWLIANRVNYDEVFYLTAGCITVCVCPQLSAGDSSILPGGIDFTAKVYCYKAGAEKLVFICPHGLTLSNMQPGDPYLVIPVYEPGEYRVEFVVWISNGNASLQGNYTYSILTNSLTEFLGHRMAPSLVSNNLNTLLDGDIARVNAYEGSTQENIASYQPVVATRGIFANMNQAASSSTVKSAAIRANCLAIYDNTGNNNDGGTIATAQLPTGVDYTDVLRPPRYADNYPTPPPAYQSPGLASPLYCDPAQSLSIVTKHAIKLRIQGVYKSFHGFNGRKELEYVASIVACRAGQLRAATPVNTIVSQYAFDYRLEYQRPTVTVITASPNAAWFAPPAGQQQALLATSPLDYSIEFTVTGEYNTENMWLAGSVRSSLTTWQQVEVMAYILGQLEIAAMGNDAALEMYRRLPPQLRDRLEDYMRKGISQASFGIMKKS